MNDYRKKFLNFVQDLRNLDQDKVIVETEFLKQIVEHIMDYERTITWNCCCPNKAEVLDQEYEYYEKYDKLRNVVDEFLGEVETSLLSKRGQALVWKMEQLLEENKK